MQFLLGRLTLLSLRLAGGTRNDSGGERASSQFRRFFKKVSACSYTSPPELAETLHEPGADYKPSLTFGSALL